MTSAASVPCPFIPGIYSQRGLPPSSSSCSCSTSSSSSSTTTTTTTATTCTAVAVGRRRRRCRPLVQMVKSSTLLTLWGSSASWYHATAAAAAASHADIAIVGESEGRRQRRHHPQLLQQHQRHPQHLRQMKQDDDDDDAVISSGSGSASNSKNVCKETENNGYLYAGDTLSRGEFLCHGESRFGIDSTHGYFMLGFINWTELAMIESSKSNATTSAEMAAATEEDNTDNGNIDNEKMMEGDTESLLWDNVTPTLQAWRAIPTTLFTPINQTFAYVNLTENGNILGYDDEGNEIYDSNYDDVNALGTKREQSILSIFSNCWHVATIDVEEGELCVKLTSPPRAGMPYGTDTWGIRVYPEMIVPVETMTPPSMAPSTMTPSTASPTSTSPTTTLPPASVVAAGLDVAQAWASLIPTYSPSTLGSSSLPPSGSSSSSTENNMVDAPTFHPSNNLIGESNGEMAHIWGKVWLDSNRNGEVDVGETTVPGFRVTLFECSEDGEKKDSNSNKVSGSTEVHQLITDYEGMFFLEVPSGKSYQVHFEGNPDEYGFSSGLDTGTDKSGWSECKTLTTHGNVEWKAGLFFLNETSYNGDSTEAFIGGHIYLDVIENGDMDPVERTASVGVYPVDDAKIVVSLTNCMTDEVVGRLQKRFPCTYSFGNLTEGSYRLRYEIQALTRVITPNDASSYYFVKSNSSTYEMSCGKLGYRDHLDSGDVAVRSLRAIPPSAGEAPNDGASQKSAADANASTLSLKGENVNSAGRKNSFVPTLVGSIVAISIVAASAAIFVLRKRTDLSTVPIVGSGKTEKATRSARSVGSDRSFVSGASNTQNTAIGSLIVDAETIKGDDGIELGIRQLGTTRNSALGELPEEESVGFEVYDDEDDVLQGSLDYGPVISNMIAKFSQKHGQDENAINRGDERDSGSMQVQNIEMGGNENQSGAITSPIRPQKNSPHRHRRRGNRSSNASAEMYQTEAQHHNLQSQSHEFHASQDPVNVAASNVELSVVPGNAQSYISGTYDESRYQYNSGDYIAQDKETVASGSSRSTDPPAASYRDIPAPHVGWNRDIQLVGDFRQYETPNQYVAGNGVPHQMMNHYIEHLPVDSGNSIPNSEEAGRHASSSGWSGFSPAANSLVVAGVSSPCRRSYKTTAPSKAGARRAHSNPRDGQLSERWRHKDLTPANSTVEYNAYSTASAVSADDDKTVLSLGSDQSSDPPGASYMILAHVPPPVPPHRTSPPRKFSPNNSPNLRRDMSYPSPPPRSYPSPPPRSYPSPPLPLR